MKVYKHKSGLIKEIGSEYWSWKAFLFGPLYYWYKGMVLEGTVLMIANIVTFACMVPFIAWIFGGWWFPAAYEEKLLKDGYKLVE